MNLPTSPVDGIVSPSRLAAEALGVDPLGLPWQGNYTPICALERRPLFDGEPVLPWRPGPNFMDDDATTRSPLVNGYAAIFLAKAVMLRTQRMVFCREGAFPLATDAARAWFFLTPPEPPFVAVIADSMLQHLVWRTPVNHSRDVFLFRHGGALRIIRRAKLQEMVDLIRGHDGPVFARLDRDGKDPDHGQLRTDAPAAIVDALADVTPGELLALASLVKRNPPEPLRPEPVLLAPPLA